jgi:hypothetical protein
MRRVSGRTVLLAAVIRQSLVVGLIHRASTSEADVRFAKDTQRSPLFHSSGSAHPLRRILLGMAIAEPPTRSAVAPTPPAEA